MSIDKKLLSSSEALLVLCSLNAKEEDRYLERSEIYPVQIVLEDSIIKLPFFHKWGKLGVSSAVYLNDHEIVFYLSTGSDLILLKVGDKIVVQHLEIPYLDDVHEMTLIDDLLWLANTGYDEAVAYDLLENKVVRRIQLKKFMLRGNVIDEVTDRKADEIQEVDHFHCNQIFKGIDGKLYGLVHHVTGRQIITRVAKKILKKQGDGGVIDLESGRQFQLWLKSPHTVRIVNGDYWVFDSGSNMVNVYDKDWQIKKKIVTAGLGRGAALSATTGLFYAGISAKRKRYLKAGEISKGNMVQVFRSQDGVHVGEIKIADGLEQINNVYLVPRDVADALIVHQKV
jgi:hypothetical protein